jgi:hypothetical protein
MGGGYDGSESGNAAEKKDLTTRLYFLSLLVRHF